MPVIVSVRPWFDDEMAETDGRGTDPAATPASASVATVAAMKTERRMRRSITRYYFGVRMPSDCALVAVGQRDTGQTSASASTDQFYGTMTLTLNRNSYSCDFESALRNPGAPAGTPASYSDTGSGTCHGPAN